MWRISILKKKRIEDEVDKAEHIKKQVEDEAKTL